MPSDHRTDQPALSLIVCTLGRGACLDRLFASLAAQSESDFEIVLVDQNPPGHLDEIVAAYRDRLAIQHMRSRPGLSRARNVGLRECRGAVVAFPDDDCWYDPGVVATVLAFFRAEPGIALLTGRTLDAEGVESLAPYLPASAAIDRRNVFRAGTSNTLFVRRNVALAVAGFDESLGVGAQTPYLSGEETDLILRVLAAGYAARFEHGLVVRHPQNALEAPERVRRAGAYSAGFGRLLRLHAYGPAFLGTLVARTSLRGLYCLIRGDRTGAETRFRWIAGSIRGYAARVAPPQS